MKNYKFVILSILFLLILAYLAKRNEKETFTKKVLVEKLSSKKTFPEHSIVFTKNETIEFLKIFSSVKSKYKEKNTYIKNHSEKFYESTVVRNFSKGDLQIYFDTMQVNKPIASMYFYTTNIKTNKNTKLSIYDFNSYTFDFYYLKDLKIGYGIVKMNSKFLGDLFFFDMQVKSLH